VADNPGPDDELLHIEGDTRPQPPIEKVRDYYVTTVGGLEAVALRDLKAHLKGLSNVRVEPGSRHGRIFFRYERSPRLLLGMRSVQNVYALLGEIHGVTPGKPGLLRLARGVAGADIVPAVALHDVLHGPKESPWVSLSCTSGQGHRYSASELHQVVQTVVWGKYEIPDRGEGPPYRLHLQIVGRRALFGMQVPLRRMQDRDYRSGTSGGGLDATLAYCMAYLGRVEPRDVCLDPICRDCTTLVEAGLAFGPRLLLGGGAGFSVLAKGAALVAASEQALRLVALHAEDLPVAAGSVDKVLCDLRGRTPVPDQAQAVLSRYLTAFARALKPKRTAVVLVDDARGMNQALSGCSESFTQLQRVPVHLSGRKAWICVLKRGG